MDRYDVFISYSSQDEELASQIAEKLSDRGKTYFLAPEQIQGGDKFKDKIRDALKSANEVFVLVTPNSLNSEWVTTEWGAAWALDTRIVPILHRVTPGQLPSRLADLQARDYHEIDRVIEEYEQRAGSRQRGQIEQPSPQASERGLPQVTDQTAHQLFRTNEGEIYQYQAERYGFGHDLIEVECTINSDGSAQVRRRVKIMAYSDTSELDGYLTLADAPAGAGSEIDYLGIGSLDREHSVTTSQIVPGQGQNSVLLRISPPLKELESTEYELVEKIPANFYGQDDEDMFGWGINRPTRKLSLRVYFPQNYRPDVYSSKVYVATVAPGVGLQQREHHEEQKRLQGPFRVGPEGGRYHLKLDVDYPMTGLIYVIHWNQPAASN